MVEKQSSYIHFAIKTWQLFLVASFPLQFISQRFYFYSLIAASAAFLLSKPWLFRPEKKQLNLILLFIGFVVFHAVSLIWTQDFNRGLKELETYSALFSIPVLLLWQKDFHSTNYLKLVKIVIVSTVFILCFLAHTQILVVIIQKDLAFSDLFFSTQFHYEKLADFVQLHPTYFGVLIITAIILLSYDLLKSSSVTFQYLLALTGIIYLLIFLLLLLARGPILGLVGISLWILLLNFKKISFIKRTLVIFIILIVSSSIFIFEPLTKRFVDPVARMIREKSFRFDDDSFSYHIRSWICSLHSNQTGLEVLIGQGTGDELTALNNCYASKNYSAMINSNLNAHCEYLTQYVKLGLLGLSYFIFFLLFQFNYGNINSFSYLKLMVIFLSIIFLFESILNVSKGVFFISFLFPYFYLLDKENAKTSI